MKRSELTEKLLDIKREKGWSWKYICEKIGGYSEVLIVGAILGQMKLTKPQAANAAELSSERRLDHDRDLHLPRRIRADAHGSDAVHPGLDPLQDRAEGEDDRHVHGGERAHDL